MGVRDLVEGFSTALQYMVEGDDWMVFIPQNLAYGASEKSDIRAYSTLQFRIHMIRWYESGSGIPTTWE
jgi:FKBP-type peptidyl-prolyl cis-trans isomerase